MKAVTLHQPWAWAVVAGGKNVENRSWVPRGLRIGEQLAIHAGRGGTGAEFKYAEWYLKEKHGIEVPLVVPAGAVVGVCRLAGFCKPQPVTIGWHEAGYFGWLLLDAVELSVPVYVRGQQGLWTLPPDVEAAVMKQLNEHEERYGQE